MSLPVDQRITKAGEQLDGGAPQAAFAELRGVFREPDFAEQTPELVAALRVFARVSEELAGPELAAIAERAADFPDDLQALYDLGYECLEHDLHALAACVLERAFARAPDSKGVLSELVSALEGAGRHADACAHLKSAPILLAGSFLLRYLLAFNTMMCGDAKAAEGLVKKLGEPGDDNERFMNARIVGMLARADIARELGPLDSGDLRGWHYVITGGLVLHISPYGIDDGMHGRYAYVQDSYALCRYGLVRLQGVLDTWGVKPERVLAPPDRDSQILAVAAGRMLDVPVEPYAPGKPGLIIAYDLRRLDPETPVELLQHEAGQILFAHATCWTDTPPCSPDLTTLMYQVNVAPWDARSTLEDGDRVKTPADDGPVDALAERIVTAEPEDDEELEIDTAERLAAFAKAGRERASAFNQSGRRSPLWEGGPVKSNRFG